MEMSLSKMRPHWRVKGARSATRIAHRISKVPVTGDLAPMRIRKGALGNDRDLRVSRQHRMLPQGWQAEMLFGEEEVLATAESFVTDHPILRDEGGEVEYFHMLFGTHEIIYAEGAPSESIHLGEQGWKALDHATRDEILTLFPQLTDGNLNEYGPAARMSLKHKEGALLGSYIAGRCQREIDEMYPAGVLSCSLTEDKNLGQPHSEMEVENQ